MLTFKKILFFFFLVFFTTLVPCTEVVRSEDLTKITPEFNPLCWTQEECIKTRVDVFGIPTADALKGFLSMEAPCDKAGWGKCLPAGSTKTSISFGGRDTFEHVGTYILVVYNYVLRIAAILAVIVIIVAGVQYTVSGGNSETIGSAKKRIAGAIVGLFIAYTSYFILNTLNPALVQLRLPQTYLIRPQVLASEYCKDMPLNTHFAAVPAGVLSDSQKKNAFSNISKFDLVYSSSTPPEKSDFSCNKEFFIEKANARTCWGSVCLVKDGLPQVCLPQKTSGKKSSASNNISYACQHGEMLITYSMESISESLRRQLGGTFFAELEQDWLDWKAFTVWGACKKGEEIKVGNKWEQWDGGDEIRELVPGTKYSVVYGAFGTAHGGEDFWHCDDGYSLVGYYFKTEVGTHDVSWNDANLNIGYNGSSEAVIGTFGDMVTLDNYIPKEKLKEGFSLRAKITEDVINAIYYHKGTAPDSPIKK